MLSAEPVKEEAESQEATKRPFIEAGWYRDLSNEAYHGSFGYSSSGLKILIEHTPAHLQYSLAHRSEPTANMALGTAVHTLVLEPATFNDEFIVMPKIDKRTKIGKELFAEFEAASAGKTVIAEDMLAKAQAMADSVRSHPVAGLLLEDVVSESSIYWWYKTMDPDDSTKFKTMLKVRPDAICRNYPVIIDLKSTVDGSYSGFIRSIQNYYYHVSAAMYLEGVNQCKPLLQEMGHFAYTKFLFVCVESAEPYLTSIYELSPEYLDIGKLIYRRCLHTLKHGQENNWPGFPEEVRIIEPPGWASRGYVV